MMQRSELPFLALSLVICACGSNATSPGGGAPSKGGASSEAAGESSQPGAFKPPSVPEGYTRFISPTVEAVPPGGDVTYCQYVMAPLDHDVDVLGVSGAQSRFGHHAAAFTYAPQEGEEVGSNFPCMGTEFTAPGSTAPSGGAGLSMGAFLGALGGEGSGPPSASLPEGVAFRLKKGNGIMLNVHYLNTGTQPIDGKAVLDVKLAPSDPDRTIASMFVNLNVGFALEPAARATSTIDCVAQSDLSFIMFANHMHEYGTSASTQIMRADGGEPEVLRKDETWAFDQQFNPVYDHFPLEAPVVLHAGDTIRTTCNWENSTSSEMKFPREMCLGVGFALTTGNDTTVPMCAQGNWIPKGL